MYAQPCCATPRKKGLLPRPPPAHYYRPPVSDASSAAAPSATVRHRPHRPPPLPIGPQWSPVVPSGPQWSPAPAWGRFRHIAVVCISAVALWCVCHSLVSYSQQYCGHIQVLLPPIMPLMSRPPTVRPRSPAYNVAAQQRHRVGASDVHRRSGKRESARWLCGRSANRPCVFLRSVLFTLFGSA